MTKRHLSMWLCLSTRSTNTILSLIMPHMAAASYRLSAAISVPPSPVISSLDTVEGVLDDNKYKIDEAWDCIIYNYITSIYNLHTLKLFASTQPPCPIRAQQTLTATTLIDWLTHIHPHVKWLWVDLIDFIEIAQSKYLLVAIGNINKWFGSFSQSWIFRMILIVFRYIFIHDVSITRHLVSSWHEDYRFRVMRCMLWRSLQIIPMK